MNLLIIQSLNVLYVFTLIILIKFRYLFGLIIFQKNSKTMKYNGINLKRITNILIIQNLNNLYTN